MSYSPSESTIPEEAEKEALTTWDRHTQPEPGGAPISGWAVHKQLLIPDIFGDQDLPHAEHFDTEEEARVYQTQRITVERREGLDGKRKLFVNKGFDGIPITKDHEGWAYRVPIRGRDRSGKPYSGPWLADILQPSSGPIVESDISTELDRFFGEYQPQAACCLSSEWPWKKIEVTTKRSPQYNLDGIEFRALEPPIIDVVRAVEACLKRQCPNLTAKDISNFWESWEIERFLSEFCGKILAHNPAARDLAGFYPSQTILNVLNWVRRKIYGYANNVREEIPFHTTAEPWPTSARNHAKQPGRKAGTTVDGTRLKEYRGAMTQEDFAAKCDVSVDTIQRGEAGERWSASVFTKVADTLTMLRGEQVKPQNLEKPQN